MKNKLLLIFMLLVVTVTAFAQRVEGVVLDENKEPVIGATIQIKGVKGTGTISDLDGKFSIEVPNIKNDALVVSYIGYKVKHFALNGRTMVTIELQPDITELDEVVVVGYGNLKKSDLTGSVTSVKTSDAEAAVATSFDKMLQGKAAGVMVSTGSSAPGGAVNVRIRGTSSLRGDNSPLYVVDGNIISGLGDTMDPMGQGTGGGNSRMQEQNPLASISPQDIENIEILKDASATAIYGSQGANGVILITTKQGKEGKPTIVVSANATTSHLTKEIPMLSTYEYEEFYNSFIGEGGNKLDMSKYRPVNWQKFSTRTAISQNYRASLSGKGGKTNYYISTGYSDQEGIIKQTNVSKYDIRINLKQEITKMVSLTTNTFFSSLNTNMTSGTDKLANSRTSIVRHMVSYKPLMGETDTPELFDETISGPDAWFKDFDDKSEENMFNTNLTLDIKPLKWLTIRVKGGMVLRTKERSMWYGTALYNGANCNGKAGISNMKVRSYNTEALMMFDHKFNKNHSINGTVGVVYDNKSIQQNSITAEDFFSKDLRADGISQARKFYPFVHNKVGEQLFSVLARAVYNFKQRYVLTGTFRADGSSKFSMQNRFSYFPSFAFAWRVNQESFLKDVEQISNLKLRLGWGTVGNQAISPYQILQSYNNNNYSKPDGSADPGLTPKLVANPDLKWETSEQYNVGLDLGLFEQRLTFTVDAYLKNTRDLLQQIALPQSSGFATMWINNGKVENKGIELSVTGLPIQQKDWEWTVGANITFAKNTIKDLGMSPSSFGVINDAVGYWGSNLGNNTFTKFPANVFLVGQSIGLFMGYQTNGIMQQAQYDAQDPNKRLKIKTTEIMPGDILYVDQNGDGVVNDDDRVILGNPNPDFVFGFNSTLRWKNWTLDMAFNGAVGNKVINANLIDETDVKNAQQNVRKDAFFEAWTPENMSNAYPRLGYEPQGVLSDRYVEDGSYLRLAQLSIAYNFKFKKSAIRNLTITGTATNLFTVSSYSGYDPDVSTFANDTDRMGVDLTSYPASRGFTLGVSATF